jgi:hypothetical protein
MVKNWINNLIKGDNLKRSSKIPRIKNIEAPIRILKT